LDYKSNNARIFLEATLEYKTACWMCRKKLINDLRNCQEKNVFTIVCLRKQRQYNCKVF